MFLKQQSENRKPVDGDLNNRRISILTSGTDGAGRDKEICGILLVFVELFGSRSLFYLHGQYGLDNDGEFFEINLNFLNSRGLFENLI